MGSEIAWQHIGIDLCGPFPSGESLLVAVDYYSRWFEVGILYSTNTAKVINCLDNWFTSHGLPELIASDNGVQFTSQEFKDYVNGIKHRKVTPYSSQANGEVERQNRTIMKAIKTIIAEGNDQKKEFNTFLKAYRSTPHTVTNVSPAELMYGRKMRTKLPEFCLEYTGCDDEIRMRDSNCKEKGKKYYDKRCHVKKRQVNEGDVVVLQQKKENKLSPNFIREPYRVLEKKGNSIQIESSDGIQRRRNVIHMKKINFENEQSKFEYWNQNKEVDLDNCNGYLNVTNDDVELDLHDTNLSQNQQNINEGHDNVIVSNGPMLCNTDFESRPKRIRKPPSYLKDYVR